MRQEFIEVKTRKEAVKLAPWATVIKKVDGGYKAYESVADYYIAKNQK
jgi:hypothetical protein